MQYHTQRIELSGAVCGPLWTLCGAMAGRLVNVDLAREKARLGGDVTFRDVLDRVLVEEGGDFQSAAFTCDTVVSFTRVAMTETGRQVHVRETEVRDIYGCADLVEADVYVCDFMGDDDD